MRLLFHRKTFRNRVAKRFNLCFWLTEPGSKKSVQFSSDDKHRLKLSSVFVRYTVYCNTSSSVRVCYIVSGSASSCCKEEQPSHPSRLRSKCTARTPQSQAQLPPHVSSGALAMLTAARERALRMLLCAFRRVPRHVGIVRTEVVEGHPEDAIV